MLSQAERSKRWRLKNAARLKRKRRQYYLENRETELTKAKERERKKRVVLREQHRLSPSELAACQQDPTLAWTIRGPEWIACIEDGCGALCGSLGPHLRQYHGLTARAYKSKTSLDGGSPRYSRNASLSSIDLRARLSKTRTNLRLGKRLHASGKVPPVRKLMAARKKRVFSQQYRIEQCRRKAGIPRPGRWGVRRDQTRGVKVDDWQIATLIVQGFRDRDIAKRLSLSINAISKRRLRMGFPKGLHRLYWHGRPLTGQDLLTASHELQRPLDRMADEMGFPYLRIQRLTSSKRRENPLPADVGRIFILERSKWREAFRHQAASSDGGRPFKLLPSEQRGIAYEYEKLLRELRALLSWLEDQIASSAPMDFTTVRNWIYVQAGTKELHLLPRWPEFFDWIRNEKELLAKFLRADFKPFVVTREFLADAYSVSVELIRKTLQL